MNEKREKKNQEKHVIQSEKLYDTTFYLKPQTKSGNLQLLEYNINSPLTFAMHAITTCHLFSVHINLKFLGIFLRIQKKKIKCDI